MMEAPKRKLTNDGIDWATSRAKDACEDYPAKALAMLLDSEKKKRQESRECKSCYYLRSFRIGGAAMTKWWCGVCEKEEWSGSTHCPRVCRDCAAQYQLCAECGGDVHMRVRRKAVLP